jgi:CubicO group peptidase (beta-lactamase class C family)
MIRGKAIMTFLNLDAVDPVQAGFSSERLERLTTHLENEYIAKGRIAGAQLGVTRYGQTAYFRSFGQMDLERAKPVKSDTIFRIYSMTKPIVSIALMMLYERGLFQLGDPVARFFPAWANQRVWVSGTGADMITEAPIRPVSFQDMLTHMGGLTYGGMLPNNPSSHPVDAAYKALKVRSAGTADTLVDFMAKLAQVPLRYQPGTQWMYSLASDVCGALVEALSGQTLDEFLAKEIFEPLGMVDTGFFVPAEKLDRFAANYQRGEDKKLKLLDDPATSAYLRKPALLSGGGGLVSTAADYLKFCEMLRRGGMGPTMRLIGSRTLAMMHRNHLPGGKDLTSIAIDSFSETGNDGIGFGLGFAMVEDQVAAKSPSVQDYYWGGAASTIFWIDPIEDMSVVFMTQFMPSGTFNFRGQLKNIIYGAMED